MDINSSLFKRWVKRKIACTSAQQPKQFIMHLKNTSQSRGQLQRGPHHCQPRSPRSQLLLEKYISQLGIRASWLLSREVEEEWVYGQPEITKAPKCRKRARFFIMFQDPQRKEPLLQFEGESFHSPLSENLLKGMKGSGLTFYQVLCRILHTKSRVDFFFFFYLWRYGEKELEIIGVGPPGNPSRRTTQPWL